MHSSIEPERIQVLNSHPTRQQGDYVLYWMQSAQRAQDNPALEFAIERANALAKPLLVLFCIIPDYPEANLRHFTFMLEGLGETFEALRQRKVRPLLVCGDSVPEVVQLAATASEVVLDKGYLRHLRQSYAELSSRLDCRLYQVEGEAVVPVTLASDKVEYAARTIRPRIHRHWDDFFFLGRESDIECDGGGLQVSGLEGGLDALPSLLKDLRIDREVPPVSQHFRGGPQAAAQHLETFLEARFDSYDDSRNQPQLDGTSLLSPYLHYGMISPVKVALTVREHARRGDTNADSYLEELIVRRGLSQNFCHFTEQYDHFGCLPEWARKSMAEHRSDLRPHLYDPQELESASTHDPYWNAAQVEMVETGYMHNYMRMYWGKKILEWSASPEQAYQTTLRLNNKYFLDGRGPVSFASVAWIFGLHDRGWPERAIYGKIRCMMASGLERKSDPKAYVVKVASLTGRAIKAHKRDGESLDLF